MLVLYFISSEIFLYLIIAISLKLFSPSSTHRANKQNIITNDSNITTTNANVQNPSYKKHNLTIQIPEDQNDQEDQSEFIQNYCKVTSNQFQCFPALLFNSPQSQITKLERLTIWCSLFALELYINSLIFSEETIMLSSTITCIICFPVSPLLSTLFAITLPKSKKFEWKQLIPYTICFLLMLASAAGSCFIKISSVEFFLFSCSGIMLLEFLVMEPFKTLIKASIYLIFKDFGLMHKFCDKI